jgi:hypothetical protein
MLSKPLIFVLQLAGLGIAAGGGMQDPTNIPMVVAGIGLVLFAGAGLRKRFRAGAPTQASAAQAEDPGETRICPYCAETIKAQAKVCRYCQRELAN